ncbi:MAG: hypothetical protein M1150_04225 [Patescibacteria group bacterium]|nr:hypothetical protein [Patescibacteria group bacterium]
MEGLSKYRQVADSQLIILAKNGESEAFGEIFSRYWGGIFRKLSRQLDFHADAEDLSQEVFEKALRSLSVYQERGFPVGSWLFKIAENHLKNYYRAKNRHSKVVQPLADWFEGVAPSGIEELVDRLDLRAAVEKVTGGDEKKKWLLAAGVLIASGMLSFEVYKRLKEQGKVDAPTHGAFKIQRHRLVTKLKSVLRVEEQEKGTKV